MKISSRLGATVAVASSGHHASYSSCRVGQTADIPEQEQHEGGADPYHRIESNRMGKTFLPL